MKTLLISTLVVLAAIFSPATGSASSTNYFLKIEGIEGESAAPGRGGQIDVLSFSWGVSQTGASKGSGGGSGKARFNEIVCLKPVDKASPKLMLACASGQRVPTAVLAVACTTDSGSEETYRILLEDVLITSFSTDAANQTADGIPVESVSLRFSKIIIEYMPCDAGVPKGLIRAGWDLKQNKRIE